MSVKGRLLTESFVRRIIHEMRGCVIWIALALLAVLVWAFLTGQLQIVADFLHGIGAMVMPDSLNG
jgi:hypothetical protein